ncbi:MAG: SBBP repeat-containing protein [Candidatus Heimdallarchaeota archaeon]|nr:SBBP repeat-containing protein [Candidatus Heimdallarchaeota archaeon]
MNMGSIKIFKNKEITFFFIILILMPKLTYPTFEQEVNDNSYFALESISPKIDFSTYLGGSNLDFVYDVVVSIDGSCFVTGHTLSNDFPTLNAYNDTYGGGYNGDAFVAKFSAGGSLLWSTFLGGSNSESGNSIAVDSAGNCYVTGNTKSSDFPTLNAYQDITGGDSDVFISKFSTSGFLLWSTYFGGNSSEEGIGIVVASDDSLYITGSTSSIDFPTLETYNSIYNGGNSDVFIAKFSIEGFLLWSTFLGGNDTDAGHSITVGNDDNCYVTGDTKSNNFPTKNALDSSFNGDYDAFVMKISRTSPPQLSYNGFYFLLIFIPIIPIIIIMKRNKK